MSELYDMVDRKKAVDPAIKIWKERADKRWKKKDDGWEAKYDFEIAEEARKEKEEEERWDNMTEEEQEAQMKEWGMIDSDADDYSDEEDSSDDDDDEEIDMEWDEQAYIEACTAESKERTRIANMTPEEKKKKAREDYDKEMKESRRKEYHRVWDDMLRCTWPRLLSYRSQMGLSNDSYQSHRYHCDRNTNQLY
tara:strand:+ start:656 stop:1237 length:582 start_codon:yes stop_codon:yes gene_type:complete